MAAQDEPFHVVQTQHYCRGRLDVWDPKITTFPGLYLAAVVWAHALRIGSHTLSKFAGHTPLPLVRRLERWRH